MALRSIDNLGRKLHSMTLISLAFRAAQDPFGKVRSMIEDMIEKLLQEVAELNGEVSQIDTASVEATEIRQAERAAFETSVKDFSESQEACAAAVQVLQEYYEGASL